MYFFLSSPSQVCVSVNVVCGSWESLLFYFLSLMTWSMFNLWPWVPPPFWKPHIPYKQVRTHTFAQTSHPKLSPLSVLAGEVTLIRANCSKLVNPQDWLQRDTCILDVQACLQVCICLCCINKTLNAPSKYVFKCLICCVSNLSQCAHTHTHTYLCMHLVR